MCSSRFHTFKSSFSVSCHVLRGRPLPHLPGTSNVVQRFIQSVLRFTCPNHRNLLARRATSKGGIHSLLHRLNELMRSTGLTPQIQRNMARSVLSNRDLMTKTFIRIERRKKWNSPQFVRPGIGVKKFTRAVFRKQTHYLFSPEGEYHVYSLSEDSVSYSLWTPW